MKSKYVCKYGLYHHKPVKNKEPSSNNGWIYTAYASASGLKVNLFTIFETYKKCLNLNNLYYITRLPNTENIPPVSRDEIIGMAYLRMGIEKHLMDNSYKLYNTDLLKPDILHRFKDTWRVLKHYIVHGDRNYFWENTLYGVYPIAFNLSYADRYSIKKYTGYYSNPIEFIAFYLYAFKTLIKSKNYEKCVLFLQLVMVNSFLIKLMDFKEVMSKEFPEDHPILQSN